MWPCFPGPYVRVIQLHCSLVEPLKGRKRHSSNAQNVQSSTKLEHSICTQISWTFLLLLCSRTMCEDSIGQTGRKIKARCLGKVAIGSHVAGKGDRDHWLTVIQNTQSAVSVWHTLKWRWRWVKLHWLISWYSRVVCRVTKQANLGRHDRSINLLICQRLWWKFNASKDRRRDKVWFVPLKKLSPCVLRRSIVVYTEEK